MLMNTAENQPPSEPDPREENIPAGSEFPDYCEPSVGEEEAEARGVRTRRWIPWAALAILVAAGILAAPYLYVHFKEWRAMRFVAEAQAAPEMEPAEAMQKYRQAVLVAPASERVRRAAMTFAAKFGDRSALDLLGTLLAEGKAVPEEILSVAEGRLATGDLDGATAALEALPAGLAAELAFRKLQLEIRLTAAAGQPAEALRQVEAEIPVQPAEQADRLRLLGARIHLQSARDAGPEAEKARDLLLEIRTQESRTALAGLRLLAMLELSGVKMAGEPLGPRLAGHPQHDSSDVLLAASVEIFEKKEDRERVINRITQQYAAGSRDERMAVARWLLQQSAAAETLEFIGEERALAESDFFLLYGDALTVLLRWKELQTLLQHHAVPGLDEAIRHLFLMRAALEMNSAPEVEAEWREVQRHLRLAEPKTILYAARYAEALHDSPHAAQAYALLVSRPDAPVEAMIGFVKNAAPNLPAEELIPIYEKILLVLPDYPEARNDYAYLRLLENKDVAGILPEVRERVAAAPQMMAYRTTAALAELRAGDAAAAIEMYRGTDRNDEHLTDSQRAVWAALLQAAGDAAAAHDLARRINRANLRPGESKLIEGL